VWGDAGGAAGGKARSTEAKTNTFEYLLDPRTVRLVGF
jgi:hypothetical protein